MSTLDAILTKEQYILLLESLRPLTVKEDSIENKKF